MFKRAETRQSQPGLVEHVAVVEGEHEIRLRLAGGGYPLIRVGRVRSHRVDAVLVRQLLDAAEPLILVWVVTRA